MNPGGQVTRLKTLGFALVRDTLIHCNWKAPDEAEWELWAQRLAVFDYSKILVFPIPGSPDARQRARIARALKEAGRNMPPAAIMTDSVLVTGIVTALRWLVRDLDAKCFAPDNVAEALRWLGASATVEGVRAAVRDIRPLEATRQAR